MVYRVVLAPRAIEDLHEIVLYVASDRPESAQRLGFALIERIRLLSDLPFMGRIVPELNDPLIRELLLTPYRIIYRIDEVARIVGVARFWHGARDEVQPDDLP